MLVEYILYYLIYEPMKYITILPYLCENLLYWFCW